MGALKNALDYDYGSMFHSTNGDAVGKDFIIDMKKIYSMDRFEYTPRQDNKGNGTVQKLDVYTSVDGKSWKLAWDGNRNSEWTYSTSTEERDTKVVDLTGHDARYIKLIVRKSKGGFFSAAELQPYTTEGATGRLMGDTNNDGVIDDKDLVQISNYVGLEDKDATWDQVVKSDWDGNKYYDAFDIAVTTTQLNGGIAKTTGSVEGSIQVTPNKPSIKAGESVEFSINGIGLKNVYALGLKLNFDNDVFSDPSTTAGIATMAMTKFDFSRVAAYNPGRNYNLVFTNIGNQSVISGSKVLGKIKFTAKKDIELTEDTVKLLFANLVGNNLSEVNAMAEGKDLILPETEKIIKKDEITSVKFSNDVNSDINSTDLWQGTNWKDVLFDGNRSGELAEFKWFTSPDSIKEVVKLPTDMSFTFNNKKPLKAIRVYKRAKGSNSTVMSMKATAYSGETSYDLGTINEFKDVYTFMLPAEATAIDRVVITPLTSNGKATGVTNGSESNRMLSLHEIEFVTDDAVNVQSVAFAENTPDEINIGRLVDIRAVVNPTNANNPFYKISATSDNVEVLETKSESGYTYTLKGLKAGIATLRVESRENPAVFAEKVITVSAFADVTELETVTATLKSTIDMYGESHLTPDCYQKLNDLLVQANELLTSKLDQDAVDSLSYNISVALNKIEFKVQDEKEMISQAGMNVVSATNYADTDYPENIIDGDSGTIWHSSYQSSAKLPVEIVTDLGGVYELKEVNYLARQTTHNGQVTKAVIEVSTDGKTFTEVAIANFASKDGWLVDYKNFKPIRFAPTEARYVKFIALETIGDTYNKYASIAELNFYANDVTATDMEFAEESVTVPVGGYVKSELNFDPITAHPDVTYESDDPENLVTVNENGVITVSKDTPDAYLGFDTTITATVKNEDGTELTSSMRVHVVKVEKMHLKNAIDTATTFTEDTTIHPVILEMLNKAIDEGQKVYDNVNATDANVKEAYDNLQFAISCANFKAPVVKKLEALIKQSNAIALNKYDPAGQEAFKEALENANDIFGKIDSEIILQDEVDNAYAELAATRAALIYLNTSEMSN